MLYTDINSISTYTIFLIIILTQLCAISSSVFVTIVEGFEEGRGVFPDVEIIPTPDDIINGNDAVMDYVLNQILN